MKKAVSILLSLLLVFGTVAFSLTAAAEAPTIIDRGACGEALTWTLDSVGTLTISGTGPMDDFHYVAPETPDSFSTTDTPWYPYVNSIQTVMIGDGVTTVGSRAFRDCLYLSNVTLPESVSAIGGYAFGDCVSLVEISMPQTMQRIASGAFYGTALINIEIPEGVEAIEHATFSECFNLQQITIPLSMKRVSDSAFYESGAHVAIYHGTQEQWDQINIPHESDDSLQLTNLLHKAFQNYLDGHYVTITGTSITSQPSCLYGGDFVVNYECAECSRSGSTRSILLPPLHHRNAYDAPAIEATETAHGHTAGLYCPDCETWLSGEVVHNALGEQRVIQEPTETEEGIVDIRCTVCGEWGRYTASATGPVNDEPGGGFWARIEDFFRGFIDWFLRLLKWF